MHAWLHVPTISATIVICIRTLKIQQLIGNIITSLLSVSLREVMACARGNTVAKANMTFNDPLRNYGRIYSTGPLLKLRSKFKITIRLLLIVTRQALRDGDGGGGGF